MTIRMSSALLGASSLDSSSSFVEIDSDNTTSRSSSHDALDDEATSTTNTVDNVHLRSRTSHSDVDDVPNVNGVNNCGMDSSDDVDTKPNVSDFMATSEHFLKNNFVAMGGGGRGLSVHHPHHPHHHHSYPGLSAALQSYHQQHHHHHASLPTVSPSIGSVGVSGSASSRSIGVLFSGSSIGSHHGGGHHPGPAKPPFMQLYKSLFANAVLQNPDKMSSAGFARNVLFTCSGGGGGSERSPPESDGEVDEKGSLVDEVRKVDLQISY